MTQFARCSYKRFSFGPTCKFPAKVERTVAERVPSFPAASGLRVNVIRAFCGVHDPEAKQARVDKKETARKARIAESNKAWMARHAEGQALVDRLGYGKPGIAQTVTLSYADVEALLKELGR